MENEKKYVLEDRQAARITDKCVLNILTHCMRKKMFEKGIFEEPKR